MTNDQRINTIKQLLSIESTAHNPTGLREAYDFMIEFVRTNCSDITIEEFESGGKPSFLAYKGPLRPAQFHLILNGHIDVVPGKPEQYMPFIRDGKLYGRGVYDMKAASVVMAEVFCNYVNKVPFALGLQIVSDEESAGIHGTLHQVQQGVRGNFVICGECGRAPGVYEIANRAKGVTIAQIGFNGKSAHGAYPWKGDNAAAQAYRFVHALHERYPAPAGPTEDTTATVTSIVADSDAPNKIPDDATITLDIRYTPDDPHFKDKAAFELLITSLDPNARVKKYYDFSSPLYTAPHDPQLLKLKAAAEAIEGHEFQFVQRNATSDGRFYGNIGNQACEFGIAGEHQHADDEHITLQALRDYYKTLCSFLNLQMETVDTPSDRNETLAFVAVS